MGDVLDGFLTKIITSGCLFGHKEYFAHSSFVFVGQPDPPVSGSLTATDTLEENDPPTSKIELRWIRGFDGGYTVTFRLFYREQGRLSFQQINIGASPDNRYSLVGMKTETTYEFTIRAVNERGLSGEYVPYLIFTTKSMSSLIVFVANL